MTGTPTLREVLEAVRENILDSDEQGALAIIKTALAADDARESRLLDLVQTPQHYTIKDFQNLLEQMKADAAVRVPTKEMIEAGAEVLTGEFDVRDWHDLAETVYEAMEKARLNDGGHGG
tara:strand:+ start:969 stop:1328 length:360 start_codon:yes stop_codon:yes gene_type:complete